jgi:hypothetical protein
MSNNPYLIIVAGPTASGKGSAPVKIQKLLNLPKTYTSVLLDDLVEANPHYRKGVQEFIDTKRKEGLSNVDIVNIFSNPTPYHITTFNNLYFESRKNTDCNSGSIIESSKENLSSNTCEAINDNILKQALDNSDNIVFETTGQWWVGWLFELFKDQLQKNKYDIIVVYSIVDLCELLFRNKSRAVQSIREFLKNDKATPPRLPDIRLNKYTEALSKIIKTFKTYNSKCSNKTDDICVRFIIFDNRSHNSTLLYDSFSEDIDNGNKVIDLYSVKSSDDCKHSDTTATAALGGKRRSYKRKKSKRSKRKRNSIKRKRKSIKRKIKY